MTFDIELLSNFKLPYCFTCHCVQVLSKNEKITVIAILLMLVEITKFRLCVQVGDRRCIPNTSLRILSATTHIW